MPSFTYRALTQDGKTAEGMVDAPSRPEAMSRVAALGLTLLRISEQGAQSKEIAADSTPPKERVPPRMREAFTRQLSSLLGAGVPLATALNRLARETRHRGAGHTWQELHDRVADGTSLADSMAQFPHVFPRVHTAMVRAGETGGFLDVVLGQIADFQERDRDLRSRVLSALLYPAVLAVLATVVVIFLLTFFIPRFETMFSDFGAALPWLTRAIMGFSEILRRWGAIALLLLTAGILCLRRWLSTEDGRRRWESGLLRLPITGALTASFARTRFCRMLGTLTGAGVPLVTALNVASQSLGNQVLTDAVRNAIERVRRGNRLADSLGECPVLFPGSVVEIISVAEQTARLDRELIRLADTTEKDLNRQLHTAVALAEPAMLFVMAAIIGTIVVGMVLPIFALQEYIK